MKHAAALVGLLALAGASGASAQLKPEVPIGSRIPKKPQASSAEESRQVLAEFARCAVKLHPDLAAALVLDQSKIGIDRGYLRVAESKCLSDVAERKFADVALSISEDIMRFGIAEALLETNLPTIDPAQIAAARPLAYPPLNPATYVPQSGKSYSKKELADLPLSKARDESRIAFYRYGECVARANAVDSSSLLRSKPNSTQETAAIKALMSSFNGCLVAGQQFKSNRTMMRGTLALAYYRLSRTPRAEAAE